MPTIEHYAKQSFLRALIQGESGASKTTTALQFPGVWVIDCDLNLGGPLRWLKANGKTLPIGYDTIDKDDEGKLVPENLRWQRMLTVLAELGKKAHTIGLRTIVFDSMSKMNDYNKAHVLRTNPTKSGGFEQTSWGFFYSNWIQLVGLVTAQPVNCVFTAHDKVDKDELDGSTKIMLNTQGQFQSVAKSMFTDVWHAEVKAEGMPPVYKRVLRTCPDYKHEGLKNSFSLPPLWEFNWKQLEDALAAGV